MRELISKESLVRYVLGAALGVFLGIGGVHWYEWEFWVIMFLANGFYLVGRVINER